ncbi:MAG TPA: TIM barrel protein, partial [Isosphaeraceae bacterium]|nr:TIM barrel protein [Isosphaeraceae bacterium]
MTHPNLNRRTFLRGALAGGAALSLGVRSGLAFDVPLDGKPRPGKIGDFKISLAEWSLHKKLFEDRSKTTDLNLEFPKMAREFGIDGVEFVNQFFKDKAQDDRYLKELKKRADDQGVTCVLIMIDGEGDLSSADAAERRKAVANHKKWVDAAKALGCHAIRVNTGSNYSAKDLGAAPDACRKLAEYGAQHHIEVICENHGGP